MEAFTPTSSVGCSPGSLLPRNSQPYEGVPPVSPSPLAPLGVCSEEVLRAMHPVSPRTTGQTSEKGERKADIFRIFSTGI